jgi:FixJ family two-component response regulator
MRSLGYTVETFASATDFLTSPHLIETDRLIANVHMPAMTADLSPENSSKNE